MRRESEPGTTKSSAAYSPWLSSTAGAPALIAARKGTRSRLLSSSGDWPTCAGPCSVDCEAEPRPGKCFTAVNMRSRRYARTVASA